MFNDFFLGYCTGISIFTFFNKPCYRHSSGKKKTFTVHICVCYKYIFNYKLKKSFCVNFSLQPGHPRLIDKYGLYVYRFFF